MITISSLYEFRTQAWLGAPTLEARRLSGLTVTAAGSIERVPVRGHAARGRPASRRGRCQSTSDLLKIWVKGFRRGTRRGQGHGQSGEERFATVFDVHLKRRQPGNGLRDRGGR